MPDPTRVEGADDSGGRGESTTADAPARWSGAAAVPAAQAKKSWRPWRRAAPVDEDEWELTPAVDPWADQDTPWAWVPPPIPPLMPPTRIDAPPIPPTRTDAALTPPTRADSPLLPPTRTDAAVMPPTRADAAVTPPTRASSPLLPPTRTDAAVMPPTRADSAVGPPARADAAGSLWPAAPTAVPTRGVSTPTPAPPAPPAVSAAKRWGWGWLRSARPPASPNRLPVQPRPTSSTPPAYAPLGARPTATPPLGTRPAATPPLGARPTGTSPTGARPAGALPTGVRPLGARPTGTRPTDPRLNGPAGRPPAARRRRRWPRRLFLFTLLSVACCCGLPTYFAWPAAHQYPVSAALPSRVSDLSLRDDNTSKNAAERLSQQLRDSNLAGQDVFAGVYGDGDGKRVTIFGTTGLRLNPKQDVEAELNHLTGDYKITKIQSFDLGETGLHERCGVGRSSGNAVVVCAWADHGSLGTVLLTRRNLTESAELVGVLRSAVLTRS